MTVMALIIYNHALLNEVNAEISVMRRQLMMEERYYVELDEQITLKQQIDAKK